MVFSRSVLSCRTYVCPVLWSVSASGEWGAWTPWSSCPLTCGAGGEAVRTRQCTVRPCEGSGKETRHCNGTGQFAEHRVLNVASGLSVCTLWASVAECVCFVCVCVCDMILGVITMHCSVGRGKPLTFGFSWTLNVGRVRLACNTSTYLFMLGSANWISRSQQRQTNSGHLLLLPYCGVQLQHYEDSGTFSACWLILVFQ